MSNKGEGTVVRKHPDSTSQSELVVNLGNKEKVIKDRKKMKKEKLTTYMFSIYHDLLKEISEETGVSMTKLINQALDEFLQDIDRINGSLTPPINKNFFRPAENEKQPQDTS